MNASEKQPKTRSCATINVTPLAPAATKIAIPKNGYSVHDTEITYNGQRFYPGVWMHYSTRTEEGEETARHEWLCGPLHVDAITRNSTCSEGYGRLLRFTNLDGKELSWALPSELLAGRPERIVSTLFNRGLKIDHSKQREIVSYIASQHPQRRVISTVTTGWLGDKLFVTPLESVGTGDAIFQSESSSNGEYGKAGTLEGWQKSISAILPGNPLFQLGIGASLAGTLLAPLRVYSGCGFHLLWDSSNGKTTIVMCAASVWGHGNKFMRKWAASGSGLEGLSALRNDCLVPLDELGQANPAIVGEVVYAIVDGVGKQRAEPTGAARKIRRWLAILLSSGEITLETKMREAGKPIRAGQEVRLVTVSAGRTYGAWDNLHNHPSGQALSDALQKASGVHYGHAGPAFVRRLIEHGDTEKLPDLLDTIQKRFHPTSSQAARVAKNFAILALALELATTYGLLPLTEGEGTNSMVELFESWQAGRGEGPSEDRQILRAIADFIDRHGGSRFQSTAVSAEAVRDRAGYWEHTASGRIYLFTRGGLQDATQDFELTRVLRTLDSVGALIKKEPGKLQHRKRLPDGSNPGLYWIHPARLEHVG
ncbi:DUF927 domain-containing protein [Stutzerimonas stutzeri]|uniref:DUF927 domain-containing protein n=1 Tax=Stutzerimonas stutzeri TaxID=316 RepID=UPI003D074A3A